MESGLLWGLYYNKAYSFTTAVVRSLHLHQSLFGIQSCHVDAQHISLPAAWHDILPVCWELSTGFACFPLFISVFVVFWEVWCPQNSCCFFSTLTDMPLKSWTSSVSINSRLSCKCDCCYVVVIGGVLNFGYNDRGQFLCSESHQIFAKAFHVTFCIKK